MSKFVTTAMQTALSQKLGTEPIIVLKIDWGSPIGVRYYADKQINTNGITIEGRIINLDGLDIMRYQDNYGAIGNFGVNLDDTDKALWTILNSVCVQNKFVDVYQYFAGMDIHDSLVLFTGAISSPVTWHEGEHKLSFSVYSSFINDKVGIVVKPIEELTGTDLTSPDVSSYGKVLPMVFGHPYMSPALRIGTGATSILAWDADIDFTGTDVTKDKSLLIQDGHLFPQNKDIVLDINGLQMLGSFGTPDLVTTRGGIPNAPLDTIGTDTFTIEDNNVPYDLLGARIYRPSDDSDDEDADEEDNSEDTSAHEISDPHFAWIVTSQSIKDKWVLVFDTDAGWMMNYCVSQQGDKCKFREPWFSEKPNDNDTDQGPFLVLLGDNSVATQASAYPLPFWDNVSFFLSAADEIQPVPLFAGTQVRMIVQDLWIANAFPNSNIRGVFAYRNIKHWKYDPVKDQVLVTKEHKELCPVPSSYYDVIDYVYDGNHTTALLLDGPLSQIEDEEWQDELYIIQDGPYGPNTVNCIFGLIGNFAPDLGIDQESFDLVSGYLENYPSNFVIDSEHSVIELCQEIAWQARCSLTVVSNIVYLKYLSKAPLSVVGTMTLADIKFKSLLLEFTDTERMVTRAKGVWRYDLSKDKKLTVYYENNIKNFGLKEKTWEFWIYDNRDLVQKSLRFWGKYYSECWRKFKLIGFLNALQLDLFDYITVNFGSTYPFGISSVGAVVEAWKYDSESLLIDLSLWTNIPAGAGAGAADGTFWLDDSGDEMPYDITSNIAPIDYSIFHYYDLKFGGRRPEYGIVTDSSDVDANGLALYKVKPYPNGFENNATDIIKNVRPLVIGDTFAIKDKVIIYDRLGQKYIVAIEGNKQLRVKEIKDDYLICHYYNNDIEESTDIYVLKPWTLRRTPFDGQTVNGISYAYSDNSTRVATKDTIVETQYITPDYNIDDIIYAERANIEVDIGGGILATLVDNGADGRSWMFKP